MDTDMKYADSVQEAKALAQEQLDKFPPMPENTAAVDACPGVDPMGKYSAIDMKFAQRQARIVGALQSRSPEVQEHVKGVMRGFQHSQQCSALKKAVEQTCKEHRLNSRAAKLCQGASSKLLQEENKELENRNCLKVYDTYLKGLEYAVGIRKGPMPQQMSDYLSQNLGVNIDPEQVMKAQEVSGRVSAISINFENFDNRIIQQQFAKPVNWGKTPQQVMQDRENVISVDKVADTISPYAKATVDQAISPVFDQIERKTSGEINRGDLVIVDGKTVRERMFEEYMAKAPKGNSQSYYDYHSKFQEYYAQNAKEATSHYVAAALMSGKPVEMFAPDKNGLISDQPIKLSKEGYEPSPLRPVTANGFDRFCAKLGFKKSIEKVAKAEEYKHAMEEKATEAKRMADARQRVKDTNGAAAHTYDISTGKMQKLFFADPKQLENLRSPHSFSLTRSGASTLGICVMLNRGYQVDDILDPEKLQAEREAVGQEVLERTLNGTPEDQKWLAENMVAGEEKIADYIDQIAVQTNVYDTKEVMSDKCRNLRIISQVAFDAAQENAHCKNEILELLDKRDPGKGVKQLDELEGRMMLPGMYFDTVAKASPVGALLAGGLVVPRSIATTLSYVVDKKGQMDYVRNMQEQQPNTPFSKLCGDAVTNFIVMSSPGLMASESSKEFNNVVNFASSSVDNAKQMGSTILSGDMEEKLKVTMDPIEPMVKFGGQAKQMVDQHQKQMQQATRRMPNMGGRNM